MQKRKFLTVMLLALCLLAAGVNVHAQDSNTQAAKPQQAEKEDVTNLDTQLYLIVGTNGDVADPKLPAALDTVVKQLRATCRSRITGSRPH
jgi:hypothetical protein